MLQRFSPGKHGPFTRGAQAANQADHGDAAIAQIMSKEEKAKTAEKHDKSWEPKGTNG